MRNQGYFGDADSSPDVPADRKRSKSRKSGKSRKSRKSNKSGKRKKPKTVNGRLIAAPLSEELQSQVETIHVSDIRTLGSEYETTQPRLKAASFPKQGEELHSAKAWNQYNPKPAKKTSDPPPLPPRSGSKTDPLDKPLVTTRITTSQKVGY